VNGYYLIEAGNGVISSVGFFDTAEHAEESTRVASNWVREENLEKALPNPPKITSGQAQNSAICGARRSALSPRSRRGIRRAVDVPSPLARQAGQP
jgi:hypothetical protein